MKGPVVLGLCSTGLTAAIQRLLCEPEGYEAPLVVYEREPDPVQPLSRDFYGPDLRLDDPLLNERGKTPVGLRGKRERITKFQGGRR